MGIDLSPRCAKCGAHIDINNMKALPEGKGFVCANCFERGTNGADFKPTLREAPTPTLTQEPKVQEPIFEEKDYVCDECGYTFKKTAEFTVKLCPYCGKQAIHQKVEQPAQNLLDEDE